MSVPSLYQAVMGSAFERLAAPVRRFHALGGRHELHGDVRVGVPASPAAKVLAFLLGAPLQASEGPIRFELVAGPDAEMWTRFFPNRTMRSTLTRAGNRVEERLGAAQLSFELLERDGALEMRLERMRFLGVACPAWLLPEIVARETGEAGQLHFRIEASVPLVGLVASYHGHLDLPAEVLE